MCAGPGPRSLARWSAVAALLLLLATPAARADYATGRAAYDSGDYAGAMREWKPLAERGDALAQYGLGLLFETGKGLPEADPVTAVEWYEKSAAQGSSTAQSNLGLMYAEGRGVPRDVLRAVELWRQAAASGQPSAQFNLGLTYYRGDGVARDYAEAANWFAAAALNDVAEAQFALAEMYRIGRGVMQNQDTARGWYVKAAANGNEPATRRLELYASEDASTSDDAPQESVVRLNPPEKPADDLPTVAEELVLSKPGTQSSAGTVPAAEATDSTESAIASSATTPPPEAPAGTGTPADSQPAASGGPLAAGVPGGAASAEGASDQAALEADDAVATDPPPGEAEELVAAAASTSGTEEPVAEGVIRMATPVAQPTPEPAVNRIWLTSLASAESADQSWRSLVETYPDLLGGLDVTIRKVDLGVDKGVWYRVMAGPFENRQSAKAVCEEFHRRAPGENCMAVVN